MSTRDLDFYDPADQDDLLNSPDVTEGPWTVVCQELDVFEFRHADGRGGWAEWDPDTGELVLGNGEAQGAFRVWDGDTFTTEERDELVELISRTMPMEGGD